MPSNLFFQQLWFSIGSYWIILDLFMNCGPKKTWIWQYVWGMIFFSPSIFGYLAWHQRGHFTISSQSAPRCSQQFSVRLPVEFSQRSWKSSNIHRFCCVLSWPNGHLSQNILEYMDTCWRDSWYYFNGIIYMRYTLITHVALSHLQQSGARRCPFWHKEL